MGHLLLGLCVIASEGVEDAAAVEHIGSGYFDQRVIANDVRVGRLLPADDTPRLATRTELNLQLKVRGTTFQAMFDASMFHQDGWRFVRYQPNLGRSESDDHEVATLSPRSVLHEAYLVWDPSAGMNLLVGKKRVVWGSGMLQNPTDLLNPSKDPSDPSSQRTGAYLARLEWPTESFTVTALAAAAVLRERSGIPTALLVYPEHPTLEAERAPAVFSSPRDDRAHYLLALRGYLLWRETDLNLMVFRSQLFRDAFEEKLRVGGSASRYFGDALELHAEGLVQRGSARLLPNGDCLGSDAQVGACLLRGEALSSRRDLVDSQVRLKAVVGLRYTFNGEDMLTVEYDYRGDGLDDEDYATLTRGLMFARTARRAGVPVPAELVPGGGGDSVDAPRDVAFEPMRRHYLLGQYARPRIADDFTATVTWVLSLHDGSGQVVPALTWSASEWLNLSGWLFLPTPAWPGRGVRIDEQRWGEFALGPVATRAMVTARAFF